MQAPHTALISVIDTLKDDLDKYINSGKSNNYIVESRKKLISELTTILNSIVELDKESYLVDVCNEIKKLKCQDNNIDSFVIYLNNTQIPRKTAVIVINNYLKY